MLFSILYVFFHSLVMKKKYYFFELFSIQIVGFLKKIMDKLISLVILCSMALLTEDHLLLDKRTNREREGSRY